MIIIMVVIRIIIKRKIIIMIIVTNTNDHNNNRNNHNHNKYGNNIETQMLSINICKIFQKKRTILEESARKKTNNKIHSL